MVRLEMHRTQIREGPDGLQPFFFFLLHVQTQRLEAGAI